MAESLGKLPFGKHKGTDMEDVPTSYLQWVIGEKWITERWPRLCNNIKKELQFRERFGEK